MELNINNISTILYVACSELQFTQLPRELNRGRYYYLHSTVEDTQVRKG